MVINQPLVEKRLLYDKYLKYPDQSNWIYEVDDTIFDSGITLGFNKEYVPEVFFDSKYRPNNSNSLYYQIKAIIGKNFTRYEDYHFKPVILQGSGSIIVNEAFSPYYNMNITCDSLVNIQLPLLYYPGYQITIKDLNNDKEYTLDGLNTDGLVSFTINDSGSYEVITNYVGTTTRKLSFIWFYISLTGISFLIIYIYFDKFKNHVINCLYIK